MNDAGFVAAGWIGTAAVIAAYAGALALRLRRADRGRRSGRGAR